MNNNKEWQLAPYSVIPQWFLEELRTYPAAREGKYISQILWQRGINTVEKLRAFLDYQNYQPASFAEFEPEMSKAINRFDEAVKQKEKIAIWGDFDADGVTATSVLWEGLGRFFPQDVQLKYYIPNRFTESHGLNVQGIEKLAKWGANLIVTCDTGSTNLAEISHANNLGIDVIVTDHHTLPPQRPDVVSIINPRYLPENHPLYSLSGVAVAYKLIEALNDHFNLPPKSSEELLDLVTIGLIADLVNLTGDCRYLAQKGIEKLKKTRRFGVKKLLELCYKKGDRPMDISYGIGPRINAVSRINGNADFCVQLLTSKDEKLCHKLAEETNIANTRRKELQNKVLQEAKKQIEYLDMSSTGVIVLVNSQWESGVLGLVANGIALEYGRPTILLTTAKEGTKKESNFNNNNSEIARGSARSVNGINLYELVRSQAQLLERFGGHPFAAGLTIKVENIPFFIQAINQTLRQIIDINLLKPIEKADLIVTVKDLGKDLFKELNLLEPCGMKNPAPKLLIKSCWFENVWNKNERYRGKQVKYIKTTFDIYDNSQVSGFSGVWWGHYKNELDVDQKYDAIVELDYNDYDKEYQVRLIDVKIHQEKDNFSGHLSKNKNIIDNRQQQLSIKENKSSLNIIKKCPHGWQDLKISYQKALNNNQKLVLAYQSQKDHYPQEIWQKLVGITKYLANSNESISQEQLTSMLKLNDQTLFLGLKTLEKLGIKYQLKDANLSFNVSNLDVDKVEAEKNIYLFFKAIKEQKFKENYFEKVPLSAIENQLSYNC